AISIPRPRKPGRPGNRPAGSTINTSSSDAPARPEGGGDSMKKLMALFVVVMMLGAGAGVAFARECPLLIKQTKDAAAKGTDATKKADAEKLIAQAQKQHDEGKHADSVKTADEAAKVLGVKLEHKQ